MARAAFRLMSLVCVALVVGVTITTAQETAPPAPASPEALAGTAFTFQGRLTDNSLPPTNLYDFQFRLYDAATGGAQLAQIPKNDVAVTNGQFTVELDYGANAFKTDARWLELGVRPGASTGAYQTLTPRLRLTLAPFAVALPGLWTQQNTTSANVIGGYSGNTTSANVVGAAIGGGGAAGNTNRVADSYGTVSGGQNNRAGSDDADVNNAAYSTIGGGITNASNSLYGTVGGGTGNTAAGWGATVGGGSQNLAGRVGTVAGGSNNRANSDGTTIGGGSGNQATSQWGTVAGGATNTAGFYAMVGGGSANVAGGAYAFVGGGQDNQATANFTTVAGGGRLDTNNAATANRATDQYATVGGGGNNQAGDADGDPLNAVGATVAGGTNNVARSGNATVGGGSNNQAVGGSATVGGGWTNRTTSSGATIAGGFNNSVNNFYATIGGGIGNIADGVDATVAGGMQNTASGDYHASVGGGSQNVASGYAATISGGAENMASNYYAAVGGGQGNTASGFGSTVPGGRSNAALGERSFAAGYRAKADYPGCFVWGDTSEQDVSCGFRDRFIARASGGFYLLTNASSSVGVWLPSGSGSWISLSDRAAKENVRPVDEQALLDRLAAVPISTWNYTTQDAAIRHIGPMAQDFAAAFGVGEDDKHISTVDADGVALAASQALYVLAQDQQRQLTVQQAQIDQLQKDNADLAARLAALERPGSPEPAGRLAGGLLPLAGWVGVGLAAAWTAQRGVGAGRSRGGDL